MTFRIRRLPTLLAVGLLCCSLFSCSRESVNDQIGHEIVSLELKNGLTLFFHRFSYGLGGQHERLFISNDSIVNIEKGWPVELMFWGDPLLIIRDTLPNTIIYTTQIPENSQRISSFHNRLKIEKVGGSELYYLSRSNSPSLIKVIDE